MPALALSTPTHPTPPPLLTPVGVAAAAQAAGAQDQDGGAQMAVDGAQPPVVGANTQAGGALNQAGGAQMQVDDSHAQASGRQTHAGGAQSQPGGVQTQAGGAQTPAANAGGSNNAKLAADRAPFARPSESPDAVKLRRAYLARLSAVDPVRGGGDTISNLNLWKFASSLNVSPDKLNAIREEFNRFFEDSFRGILTSELNSQKLLPFSDFVVAFREAGSMRNQTYLDASDLDVIVVLNDNHKLSFGPGKDFLWNDRSLVSSAQRHVMAEAVLAAAGLYQVAASWTGSSASLISADTTGYVCLTYKSDDVEFDVLPAFMTVPGQFFLVAPDGELTVSANEQAANMLERLSKRFKGLRELIRSLKLLANRWWNDQNKDAKAKSSMFEAVACQLAERLKDSEWNDDKRSPFKRLVDESLLIVEQHLSGGAPLLPLNAPAGSSTDDLLRHLRKDAHRESFLKWLQAVRQFDDRQLLAKLEELAGDSVGSASAASGSSSTGASGTDAASLRSAPRPPPTGDSEIKEVAAVGSASSSSGSSSVL